MMTADTTVGLLDHLLGKPCSLRLFTNEVQPTPTTKPSDLVEVAVAGYAPKTLTPSDWAIRKGIPCEAKASEQTFRFQSPAGQIRGLYLTRGDRLLWAERFRDDVNLFNQLDSLSVSPTLTAS